MKTPVSVALFVISSTLGASAGQTATSDKTTLEVTAIPLHAQVRGGDSFVIDVIVRNAGKEPVHIYRSFEPEGWVVRFTITGSDGTLHYVSPAVKVEMTAAGLQTTRLESDSLAGHRFTIRRANGASSPGRAFPPGQYRIQATYANTRPDGLSGSEKVEVATGSWPSRQVSISVAPIRP